MHGESLESYIVSIIVPDFHEIIKWSKQQPKAVCGELNEEICKSPAVVKLIVDSMEHLANINKFNGLEKIKKVYLHPQPFSIENDLLTPSMKLKRGVAAKVFKDQIKVLYGHK